MAAKKFNLEELRAIREEWTKIPLDAIPEQYRALYSARKDAVDMYIEGQNSSMITQKTGIDYTNVSRLITKCLRTNRDGDYYGYQALIPQIKMHTDFEKNATVGRFTRLLRDYPSLRDFIAGNYFGDKKYTLEKNMNLTTLHQKFLKECLRLGIHEHEYPFNTENRAYVSLSKYIKALQKENINNQVKRENKNNRQKIYSTGIGKRYSKTALAPFQAVQVDGHIIDLEYTVEIVNIDGTISRTTATRAWLFAVIDEATRCILGYSVSQEFNYNQYDVVDAIKNAIIPKETLNFTIDGLKYPENGGFYSLAFPELKYALFDILKLDNAKSHLAKYTVNKIVDELQATVSFGSVATPETRGIIERFFGSLETRGFHKLPMTTGSSINDLKRNNPEAMALKYNITYDQIVELLEASIATYNNTPHSGIENLTPLESMRKKIYEAGMMPTLAEECMIQTINELNYQTETRKVIGGKNGKRAYINFKGAEYRSKELSLTGCYIGQIITVRYNPRDISTVEAYTTDGMYIGTLFAKGEFGTKSHSVKTRKLANKLSRERGRDKLEFDTPIAALEQQLSDNGKKSRRDATKADIIRREQNTLTPSQLAQQTKNKENIIELEQKATNINSKKLKYEDIKDLTPEELYEMMYGIRRG